MKRRDFLRGAGLALGVASSPAWLSEAFAGDNACDTPDFEASDLVAEIYRQAVKRGKPMLVLVIPEVEDDRWERGTLFGQFLNHGGRGVLANMALCETVCAKLSDVRRIVPDAPNKDAIMVLVETDTVPAQVVVLNPEIPDSPSDIFRWSGDYDEGIQSEDTIIEARIDVLRQALREALVPDALTLRRRAGQAASALEPAEVNLLLDAATTRSELDPEVVYRGAALVALAAAMGSPGAQDTLTQVLADAAAEQLTLTRPAGARWANHGGCGMSIEGETSPFGYACGMGYVPAKSRRFLYFFAPTDGPW